MKEKNTDFVTQGYLSFWIRKTNNPLFSDPNSIIYFMRNNNVQGILFHIVKEGINFKVEINNPKYGAYSFSYNILGYIQNDMMVVVSWNTERIRLFLNTDLVDTKEFNDGRQT
jgi:hypothetical protein